MKIYYWRERSVLPCTCTCMLRAITWVLHVLCRSLNEFVVYAATKYIKDMGGSFWQSIELWKGSSQSSWSLCCDCEGDRNHQHCWTLPDIIGHFCCINYLLWKTFLKFNFCCRLGLQKYFNNENFPIYGMLFIGVLFYMNPMKLDKWSISIWIQTQKQNNVDSSLI